MCFVIDIASIGVAQRKTTTHVHAFVQPFFGTII
jgi:hypothetical protein